MELPLQLAMKLAPVLRTPRAEVGLAFRHLATGESWTHNDRRFPAGDLIRLALALAAYHAAGAGHLELGRAQSLKNPLARAGTAGEAAGFDDLHAAPEGHHVTVRELLRRTLASHDRLAPALLLEMLDLREINRTLASWGLARTLLDAPPAEAVTTPNELAILLGHVVGGEDIRPDLRAEALTFLRLGRAPGSLRRLAGVADPAHVGATGPEFRHLAYVSGAPEGYLLVILTEGRIGAAALAKVAATVDGHYAGVCENHGRVVAVLEEHRARVAPDGRTATWDLRPVWRDGKLHVVGRVSAPEWPKVFEACRAAASVPVLDRVRRLGATPPWAIALAPVIHLRREPAHAAELVSQVAMGTVLEVLDAGEEWWLVRAPDGMLAWARSTNLQPATDKDADRWAAREQVLVTAPLLTCPRLTHGTVTLSAGTRLAFVGRRREDLLGRTPGREELLLPAAGCRYLPADAPLGPPTAQDIIRLAEPFLGVPYLWGGTSGWGLDCSGFTQLVFAMAGIRLPRDSDQQFAMAGETGYVEHIKDLAPGDLVFFKGHVGICLGRGDFVHASAPAGAVTVNALVPGAQHYASGLVKRFLGGGRVIGSPAIRSATPYVSKIPSAAELLDVLPGAARE